MRICAIRHGETDWNKIGRLQGREDIPLNETGISQAVRCGLFLRQGNWQAAVSSPLMRARQSAEKIAEILGIGQIFLDDDLMEMDCGKASGLTVAERKFLFPDGKYEGSEDREHLRTRVCNAFMKYVLEYAGKDIIIVSHGGAINSLLAVLSGGEIGSGKTRLENGCLNLFEWDGGNDVSSLRIVYYNKLPDEIDRENM